MPLKIFVVLFLFYLLYQDIRYRAIYWVCFPVLFCLMVLLGFHDLVFSDLLHNSIFNFAFLLIQLFVLTVYFSIKGRQLVNITDGLIGWGDVLFLFAIGCYLSPLNYLLFYMLSLIVILAAILVFSGIDKEDYQVPLAGLQALLLIVFLVTDWSSTNISLNSDSWLLAILNIWV